jgi:hypothetical protein
MDTQWKSKLYENIATEVRSQEARKAFQILQGEAAISGYLDPEALVGMLRSTKGIDYKLKDDAIHCLIRRHQMRSETHRLCLDLLLMALWPALDHSFFRLLPLSRCLPDLFSEIYWAFIEELERFDLGKRTKIAVNLQMNVEKRVRRSAQLELRYKNFAKAYSILDSRVDQIIDDPVRNRVSQLRDVLEEVPSQDWNLFLRQSPPRKNTSSLSDDDRQSMASSIARFVKKNRLSVEDGRVLTSRAVHNLAFSRIAHQMGLRSGAVRQFRQAHGCTGKR